MRRAASERECVGGAGPRASLRTTAAAVAALALASLLLAPPPGGVALRGVAAAEDGDVVVHLPLAGRGMDLDDLAPLQTPVATATEAATATATPTATSTPTATASPEPTAAPIVAEEDDPALEFSGSWQRISDASSSGGAHMLATEAGARMEVAFSGQHIELLRVISRDGGRADVSIDGRSFGRLEFYFGEERHQVPAVYDNLGDGPHRLSLTVSESQHASSRGHNVTVDVVRAPSFVEPSADQVAGVERANVYRDRAGLPPIKMDRAINLAAQAHADYDVLNSQGHNETFGRPGFTGARFYDRTGYFGYDSGSFEVMFFGQLRLPGSVDGWVATVYHRLPFMDHSTMDTGAGIAEGSRWNTTVMDFGSRGHVPPTERLITTYPASGQSDVPTDWDGNEAPEPLPGASYPVGYPVSLHIQRPVGRAVAGLPWRWDSLGLGWRTESSVDWRLDTAELLAEGGHAVSAFVLDQASDPNKFLGADVVFVIARQPLAAGAEYTAHVSGRDSADESFDRRWSFTTAR